MINISYLFEALSNKTANIFFLPINTRPKGLPPLKIILNNFWHTGIIYNDKVYETFSNQKYLISNINDRLPELKLQKAIFIKYPIIPSKLNQEIKSGTSCDEFVLRCTGISGLSGSDKGQHFPEDVYYILSNKYVYRSGPEQNIKEFNPRPPQKTHNDEFKKKQVSYASTDISYASGFCFEWSDNEGFEFGKYSKYDVNWSLTIPKKYTDRLNNKCSMYILENNGFIKIKDISTPECYSDKSVKVIKEIKFNNCYDCLQQYGVLFKLY